jgi:DNA-binding GntR family transcriptional regulator
MALQREGVVVWKPRRGFLVAGLTSGDIMDLFNVQAHIAGELAARASELIPQEALDSLVQLQSQLQTATAENDSASVSSLNYEFHRVINRSAVSPALSRLLSLVVLYVPVRFFGSVEGWAQASADDHAAILDALQERDSAKARTAMALHIRHAGILLWEHRERTMNLTRATRRENGG